MPPKQHFLCENLSPQLYYIFEWIISLCWAGLERHIVAPTFEIILLLQFTLRGISPICCSIGICVFLKQSINPTFKPSRAVDGKSRCRALSLSLESHHTTTKFIIASHGQHSKLGPSFFILTVIVIIVV